MHLGSFHKGKVQNENMFGGGVAKISNIFCVCLIFLVFFGVNSRYWVQAYISRK